MRMYSRKLIAVLFVCSIAQVAMAQRVLVGTDSVDFVGLQESTLDALLGSLEQGDDFEACAIVMREKFGFKETGKYKFFGEGRLIPVMLALEPGKESLIRYRQRSEFTVDQPNLALFKDGLDYRHKSQLLYESVLREYAAFLASGAQGNKQFTAPADRFTGAQKTQAGKIADFINTTAPKTSVQMLGDIIEHDANPDNRVMAISLLVHHYKDDRSFFLAVRALKDPDPSVRLAALSTIFTLNKTLARNVKWEGHLDDVKDIMNGTYLHSLYNVLELLTNTKIAPDNAKFLLKAPSADFAVAFVECENNLLRKVGHNFLAQISGQDFGYDAGRWRAWIKQVTHE